MIGFSPGGREGVLCASGGRGGKASAGGGDVGEAKGFVMYDASEVIDGIGSRSPSLLDLRLLVPFPPLPLPGDLLEGLSVWPLFCFGERLLEGGLPEELEYLRVPLTGG